MNILSFFFKKKKSKILCKHKNTKEFIVIHDEIWDRKMDNDDLEDIETYKMTSEKNILDLLLELGFVASKGEAKRLIAGGGVKIDNEKISDTAFVVSVPQEAVIIQAGKRKFKKLEK